MPPPLPPQRVSIRRKVLFGFGFVLLMLAVIAVLTWSSTREFLQMAYAVGRSREVLETGEKLLRNLMEVESSRRGFLITGDERHLNEYQQAQTELNADLAVLKGLTADSPEQRARVERLKMFVDRSLRLQRVEIERRRWNGFEAGAVVFRHGASDTLTTEIRDLVFEFQNNERAVLAARADRTEFIGTAATFVITIGTSLTLVTLFTAGTMILRDIAARRRAEEALADQHNLLSSVIDTMPDNFFVKDVKGRYIMDNRAHRQYLRLPEGRTTEGRTVFDFFPKAIAKLYDSDDQLVLETGQPLRNREEPGLPASTGETWLSTTKVPLRDHAGRILGLVCVSADITERKAAEEQLKRFAAQLERSNSELQNFASVASHDLQEPLRKILAFGDRLRAKSGPQLGESGLDYLERMQSAAERMRILIQDLLKLSRVTSRGQPFERCDLGTVVGEVLSDLEIAIEQKGAKIEVGPLPAIDADPVQMRQLLQNLIANAIKFQKPGEVPEVIISGKMLKAADHQIPGAVPGDDICQIMVQDNGIGFDEKFAEQIFVVFQRLHSRSEFEGTGIGLAVCRKITDRHGGSIVAKSSPGQGATFIVTLPVHQPLPSP